MDCMALDISPEPLLTRVAAEQLRRRNEELEAQVRDLLAAKADAEHGLDAAAFSRLKSERDALKRALRLGTVWTEEAP